MNTTVTYTDSRSYQIEATFGRALAVYADRNLAGWVLDMLTDNRVERGDTITTAQRFICGRPNLLQLVGAQS